MKSNAGSIDRILRIAVGIGLLAFFALGEGSVRYWGLVGLVPLGTGLYGFCPVYALLGINTCPARR